MTDPPVAQCLKKAIIYLAVEVIGVGMFFRQMDELDELGVPDIRELPDHVVHPGIQLLDKGIVFDDLAIPLE